MLTAISKIPNKMSELLYNTPRYVSYCFFLIYCRLYKFVNTCYFIEVLSSLYYNTFGLLFFDSHKQEWKTHWQSPVCRTILKRKYFLSCSRYSLTWAVMYIVISLFLYLDLKNNNIASLFGTYKTIVWLCEAVFLIISAICALISFGLYAWSVFSKPMPISPVQQRLFRISQNDPGFEVKNVNVGYADVSQSEQVHFFSWRNSLDSIGGSPLNYSYNSWGSNSPGSPSLDMTSSSWSFYRPSSPLNCASTPKSASSDKGLSKRLNFSDNFDSPYDNSIKTKKQLDEYLKAHEDMKKMRSMSFDESKPLIHPGDNSPMSALSKVRYQRAYRLPHNETTEDDSSEIYCSDNILHKLKITDKMITAWCERVRKWTCQTILVKLVHEIEEINFTLNEIGLPEFQIGSISSVALHQIAVTKAQHLPTLTAVLPYVDVFSNQEYVVHRLKDLARGGCMGDFKWNLGGTYDDKRWCDDLPNDSSLIMHVLCCYFDAHLPPDPHFPEGKPFSSKYFKKAPEKMVLSKDLVYIYQASVNPPQFKVVIGEDVYSLPKGRNNMFCALVLFFYHIKTKECGMLGRVNLGPSGLNLLWVVG